VTLAARSIDAAALSAEIARQRQLDDAAAYLLGLLHLAPQWIEAASGPLKPPPTDILPPWLCDALDTIDHGRPGQVASAAKLVAPDAAGIRPGVGVTDDSMAPPPRLGARLRARVLGGR
jgi:hypothetical protein